jgi:hypothetical protein
MILLAQGGWVGFGYGGPAMRTIAWAGFFVRRADGASPDYAWQQTEGGRIMRSDHDTVPYKMTFEGMRTVTGQHQDSETGELVLEVTIRGTTTITGTATNHATYDGKYEMYQEHTVVIHNDGSVTLNGSATLTAANGDQVFADCFGTGSIGRDEGGNPVSFYFPDLEYLDTGGTGRFDGVSGTIHTQVTADITSGVVAATGEGEFSVRL